MQWPTNHLPRRDDIGIRIETQIQGLQAQTDDSLCSLVQRIADLELENSRLKRTIKGATKHGAKTQPNRFGKLGKLISLNDDASKTRQKSIDSTPFVVGLIDGSKVALLHEDVCRGRDGGIAAADRWHDYLADYMTGQKVFEYTWRLIIKFYGSMSMLGTIYLKTGIIQTLSTWREFIDGFNSAHNLCCFVDAGNDDQTVQQSIRDQVELCFGHGECQHTILVASDNDSYTGFLRHYEKQDEVCGHLTVIEAIPFPGAFEELANKFLPVKKDTLYDSKDCLPLTRCSTVSPPSSPVTPKSNLRATSLFGPDLEFMASSPARSTPRSSPKLTQSAPRARTSPLRRRSQVVRPIQFLSQGHLVKRKPLANTQTRMTQARLPRNKSAFFNSNGQRIDSNSYAHMYTERYLQC